MKRSLIDSSVTQYLQIVRKSLSLKGWYYLLTFYFVPSLVLTRHICSILLEIFCESL